MSLGSGIVIGAFSAVLILVLHDLRRFSPPADPQPRQPSSSPDRHPGTAAQPHPDDLSPELPSSSSRLLQPRCARRYAGPSNGRADGSSSGRRPATETPRDAVSLGSKQPRRVRCAPDQQLPLPRLVVPPSQPNSDRCRRAAERPSELRFGPPEVRFTTAADAVAWFGRVAEPTVYTWTLTDPKGRILAASAAAFPVITMAELDARRIQEFAEELQLKFVPDPDGCGIAWAGYRDGVGILTSTAWHAERTDALHEATIAVGLLAIASVDQYAALAD